MKIACPRGHFNGSHPLVHDMTDGAVERLIYILTAWLADEEGETDKIRDSADSYSRMQCPLDLLRSGRDPEMYAEHIESMVEQRRRSS